MCCLNISTWRRVFIRQELFHLVFQADSPLRKIFGKCWQAGKRGKKVSLLGLCIQVLVVFLAVVLKHALLGLNWNKYVLMERNKQTCCGFCPCENMTPCCVNESVLYVIIYIFLPWRSVHVCLLINMNRKDKILCLTANIKAHCQFVEEVFPY